MEKTNKEIITEIIEDLEATVGLKWLNKNAKVTREKLIECWSEYRDIPDWKFYGYTTHTNASTAYKKLFVGVKKENCVLWKNYILNKYNYKYCSKCTNLKILNEFSIDNNKISGHRVKCKNCEKQYRKDNKQRIDEYFKQYRIDNKEKIQQYYTTNKIKILETNKEYYKKHKVEFIARSAKRHAAKLQRTPSWLTKEDLEEIKGLYIKAKKIEKETGIKQHVDHIYPLQGDLVSGLHVPNNLQVISATENLSKSNKFDI